MLVRDALAVEFHRALAQEPAGVRPTCDEPAPFHRVDHRCVATWKLEHVDVRRDLVRDEDSVERRLGVARRRFTVVLPPDVASAPGFGRRWVDAPRLRSTGA